MNNDQEQKLKTLENTVRKASDAKFRWSTKFDGSWYTLAGEFEPGGNGTWTLSANFGKNGQRGLSTVAVARTHYQTLDYGGRCISEVVRYTASLQEVSAAEIQLEEQHDGQRDEELYARLRDLYHRVESAYEKEFWKIKWTPK